MNIKINCYHPDGKSKEQIKNIKNLNILEFNEVLDGGQGGFNIDLGIRYDSFEYSEKDLIEYVIFDENNKNGLHKYTGVIKGINRHIGITDGQKITLKIEGIISLLSDYQIAKTYSGNLKSVINTFITDFHSVVTVDFPLTNSLEYLGNNFLKNYIENESYSVNISVDGTFLQALEKIFESINEGKEDEEKEHFFIDRVGKIFLLSEITKENNFIIGSQISSIDINEEGEIKIILSKIPFDFSVGEKLILSNINSQLDLSGKRIHELAFGLNKILINCGKVKNYKNL